MCPYDQQRPPLIRASYVYLNTESDDINYGGHQMYHGMNIKRSLLS